MSLPTLSTYTWRTLQRADLPAFHTLQLILEETDLIPIDSLADLENQFDDSWSKPAEHTVVAFTDDGQMVGFGRTFFNPEAGAMPRMVADVVTHPAHRADGALENALQAWTDAQAQARLPGGVGEIQQFMPKHLTEAQARLATRGYTPIRYFYRMRRDLSEPVPEPVWPEGLTVRAYTPDLNRAMMQAFNEAFLDHWNFEPITVEDWEMFFMRREDFRPEMSFVVFDGEELVAFSFNVVKVEENARLGLQQGWIQDLGTRRAWRKRGLATALLCHSMRAFQAAGLDYAGLGVDAANPTGALGIYQRLGFAPTREFVCLSKTI